MSNDQIKKKISSFLRMFKVATETIEFGVTGTLTACHKTAAIIEPDREQYPVLLHCDISASHCSCNTVLF